MIHLYVAKQGGYVGFGSGQMDHGSKRVIFKQVNWVAGRVYQYFSNKFFFSNYKSKSIKTYLETMNKIN